DIFYSFLKSGLYFSLKFNFCSNLYAAFNIFSSSKLLPINCIPIGKLFLSTPAGKEIAGTPAILTDTVQISAMYISSGLFVFEPILNAVVGDTGVSNTSYLLNTLSNSFLTNVLIF